MCWNTHKTAMTRVQAQPQYVLSAPGQSALPLATSNKTQSHTGLGGAGTQHVLPRVLQADTKHEGSHHATEIPVWLLIAQESIS